MARDYLPRRDAAMLQWMRVFAGGIQAQPYRYMFSPSDGTALMQAVTAFEQAMAVASQPETRTAVAIARKDAARNAAEQICRQYYSMIKPNGGVSDSSKIEIGVRPLNRWPRRIDCPQSPPLLGIIAATPGSHTLVFHDSMAPTRRAKPFGAAMLQLMVTVTDGPVQRRDVRLPGPKGAVKDEMLNAEFGMRNAEQAQTATAAIPHSTFSIQHSPLPGAPPQVGVRLVGQFTTSPISVAFTNADDRKKATYYGRWMSRRGEVGPWSHPVSMSIVA